MSTTDQHIQKARHNERFIGSFDILTTPFLDWVVTGIFYSALHYIDSLFAKKNQHPKTHSTRNSLFLNYFRQELGPPFWNFYRHLKDDSESGRYELRNFIPSEIQTEILPLLNRIKIHLKKYIPEIK